MYPNQAPPRPPISPPRGKHKHGEYLFIAICTAIFTVAMLVIRGYINPAYHSCQNVLIDALDQHACGLTSLYYSGTAYLATASAITSVILAIVWMNSGD